MPYDAIIIGAGMSGLAAAIRLGLYGKRVVILERHELWGGLNSFYTKDGHAFDVGLHALTNYVPARTRGAALTRVLRQLRIKHEELNLGEQRHSELRVPGLTLAFSNDFELLRSEVARTFPNQVDGFSRLAERIREHSLDEQSRVEVSGRGVLEEYLTEPLLVNALLVPLFYYGSAREDDVDFSQLVVLFRSIFLEGLSRPEGGIRPFLNTLIKRVKAAGAELRLKSGVERILLQAGRVCGVRLDSGEELLSDTVLSSAGFVPTMGLCGEATRRDRVQDQDHGRLSFMESISVLDRHPEQLGHRAATVFYSTREDFRYRSPASLIDDASGVISAPSNFASERAVKEHLLRVTVLASHRRWKQLSPAQYQAEKLRQSDAAIAGAARMTADWRPYSTFQDVFTPCTIERFTGHPGGCVYGSPIKRPGGETGLDGLFLMGTDQGYLGVVGAMMSGIAMANRHVLAPHAAASPKASSPASGGASPSGALL